eukprot:CAMPEP_0176322530 /NCGR_PEP_ID=MMETSP0121_2-20121125/71916_1 /TAXON_ID=160619 /ORGANISM="Kryptoperidinium foliaceum, Strain CCMP 1326" /LENGTH=59 /DNA_ID=CAMNT_0017665015 /DNA_START=245 /DNA_END=421 /DNA_ORIENTATION=-
MAVHTSPDVATAGAGACTSASTSPCSFAVASACSSEAASGKTADRLMLTRKTPQMTAND